MSCQNSCSISEENEKGKEKSVFKVPMKWKIEVLKNRRIWKAFESGEEWRFPFWNAPDGVYFDVAMATHPVPDCYHAGMVTPVFDLEQTLTTF